MCVFFVLFTPHPEHWMTFSASRADADNAPPTGDRRRKRAHVRAEEAGQHLDDQIGTTQERGDQPKRTSGASREPFQGHQVPNAREETECLDKCETRQRASLQFVVRFFITDHKYEDGNVKRVKKMSCKAAVNRSPARRVNVSGQKPFGATQTRPKRTCLCTSPKTNSCGP